MKHKRHFVLPKLAAAALAVVLVLGISAGAYAADVGGIQRKVQVWLQGEMTDAVLEFHGDGTYTMSPEDGNRQMSGGGVIIDFFGNERPATEEELLEEIYSPSVEYREDGTAVVYYFNQRLELTAEDFDEDGCCYIELFSDGKALYLTVTQHDGYAYSEKHYPAM